jgi:hypothetical protein
MNESNYMFVYWIIGAFNNDLETLTLTVGIVRSFESVGSALSFGVGAAHGVSPMANLIVSFVMFAICIIPTLLVVLEVPEHPLDEALDEKLEDAQSKEVMAVEQENPLGNEVLAKEIKP